MSRMNAYQKNILVVENDQRYGHRMERSLSGHGFLVKHVKTGQRALFEINHEDIGIVLLDMSLPDMNGLEALKKILTIDPTIVIIVLSTNGTIQNVAEAAKLGAFDWLQKPISKERMLVTVSKAAESQHRKETGLSMSPLDIQSKYRFVGNSSAMKRICRIIDKVAIQNTTVMITGESGTGKERVAYAIHLNSKRNDKPFVTINCAGVHETLIESELFGHKRGSFTGAIATKRGKFQMADRGTLFLDEIGDLSASAQAKLLRTIETGELDMIGTEEVGRVDVRIISATNKEIGEQIKLNQFREDLYHRINVIEIKIPPLRKRPDDIIPLANYFLEMFCTEHQVPMKELASSAAAVLLSHSWPGNVRELRNVMEKITILVDSQKVKGQHVTEYIALPSTINGLYRAKTLKQARQCFEKTFILQALFSNGWNVSRTAAMLEVPRSSLYEKIKEYDLKRNPDQRTAVFG